MKVCIIGAGMAGLCAARHSLENAIEPTIFEQTSKIGGTWVYTDKTGTDEYGIDVHSSMYCGLRTNLPKEIMGYPNFPIKSTKYYDSSYVSANVIHSYLEEYAAQFKIKKCIQFCNYVVKICPVKNEWQVIVKNLQTQNVNIYLFDYVLVCNGHYHTPFYPAINGSGLFRGKQLHSHNFRTLDELKDEDVLVIGAGPSGMDLCHEISKVAHHVTLSHHLPNTPKTVFLSNVKQRGDVKEINQEGARFADGSYDAYTVILYCTGYKYAFPFLSVECGIYVEDNFVQSLYKHCVNIKFPTMAFIGLPFYVCASQMMDLQVRFVMKYLTGEGELPSAEDMQLATDKEITVRREKGYNKRQAHMMGPYQMDYYKDLANIMNLEGIKPVMSKLHNESSQRFLDDLPNFRQDKFKIINDETFVQIT